MEKDLGVWVNNELKCSDQCGKAARKAMSVLGVIKRSFKRLDIESFKILFNTYVRPHLEYYVQAWTQTLQPRRRTTAARTASSDTLCPQLEIGCAKSQCTLRGAATARKRAAWRGSE